MSRARVSHIIGLLDLAPGIQEELLNLLPTDGREPITERQMRPVAAMAFFNFANSSASLRRRST